MGLEALVAAAATKGTGGPGLPAAGSRTTVAVLRTGREGADHLGAGDGPSGDGSGGRMGSGSAR